jgi:hypothetical protein
VHVPAHTVAPVSGASPSRAAVFTSSPQSVEIYERGAWWPGSMLGWRHDNGGTCQAWVRVEFAGVVEDAWVDLTLLRLPESCAERHLSLAREPKGATAVSRDTRAQARAAAAPQGSEVTQTQHLPLVRESGAPAAGRHVPPSGGRRRAPETAEQSPVADAPAPVDARPLGRHRAPAAVDAGRHRAADTSTGLMAAVAGDRWSPPPPRSELPPAGPAVRSAVAHAEPDLLTRPMRLEDGVGSARRSRRDSLTGV